MEIASLVPRIVGETPGIEDAAARAAPDPLRRSAEEFESVFLATVISRMFASLPTDGPFGGGHAEETFRSFLADEYAREIARDGGIGVADTVHAELVRLQEVAGQ